MAETAAALETLIAAIDSAITAKLAGADVQSWTVGDTSVARMSIMDLKALREMYAKRLEAIQSGTEYMDTFDDGIDDTGADDTVYVGDEE